MFRARATLSLFAVVLMASVALSQSQGKKPDPKVQTPPAAPPTDYAKLGMTYLNLGDLEKARANCEKAMDTEPDPAQECLTKLVAAQNEAKLVDFETSVNLGKREEAIKAALAVPVKALTADQAKRYNDYLDTLRKMTLADARAKIPAHDDDAAMEATSVKALSPTDKESEQADEIVEQAHPGFGGQIYDFVKGSWLPNILAVLVIIFLAWLGLHLLRSFLRWRDRYNSRGHKWDPRSLSIAGGRKTTWTLMPLVDEKHLGATELVMDAMARLPTELRQDPWKPASLLLRPKLPGPTETDLLIDFLHPPGAQEVTLADLTIVSELREEVQFQEVSLTDAVQDLQLTIGAYKVDSVAKFLTGVERWLKAGSPTISGTAEKAKTEQEDDTVVIRLNCSGGPRSLVKAGQKTGSAAKGAAPENRFATKARPDQTVRASEYLSVTASTPHEDGADIRALCADRVVFKLLYRLAYPNASQAETDAQAAVRQAVTLLRRCFKQNRAEETLKERTCLLQKAAYNLEFARNYLADSPQLLWLEGAALALVGSEKYDSAIARLQELEVALVSPAHDPYIQSLRHQARYNRAVLLARKGKGDLVKAISTYDDLLTAGTASPVRWLAGLGKLTGLADCDRETWKLFGRTKAKEWLDQGNKLLQEIEQAKSDAQAPPSDQDKRTLEFIACEANRALGKCCLRFADAILADDVLVNGRPKDKNSNPKRSQELLDTLKQAQEYFARVQDDADLLADQAYISLLRGEYEQAEQFACKAKLWDPDSERASYLAAEACYCSNDADARERAKAYATDYCHGQTPAIAAFAALCKLLNVTETAAVAKAS